ncbi:hypothetical protein [Thiolapillus sp.]|uniref:hypothetical protein n=1 Tax=Thiolapillus sp. TaxID=2017437 RepID=UPI003AF471BC
MKWPLKSWRLSQLPGHYPHFGGFGKSDVRLQTFIDNFIRCTGIPLEPVYTGKMLYGIYDLIERGFFRPGQRIVVLHTGGLQGSREE